MAHPIRTGHVERRAEERATGRAANRAAGTVVVMKLVTAVTVAMMAAVAAAVLASCGLRPTAVPVRGAPADVSRLVGEWEGSYSSEETGRTGTIQFSLQALRDTASGSVIMRPAEAGSSAGVARSEDASAAARNEMLTIHFVLARGRMVTGELDPYTDPRCGCRLDTRFSGVLVGDTIAGTYTSRHIDTGTLMSGRWRVVRQAH